MYSKYGIQIDTTNFSEEDLQTLCRILEEIHEKRKESEQRKANIQQYPSKAVMIHHEIFDPIGECTKNQDSNLQRMDDIISYKQMSPFNTQTHNVKSLKLEKQIFEHIDALLSPKSNSSLKRRTNFGSISIDCDINDEEFHRLSVKEKALWYENNKTLQPKNTLQVNRYSNNHPRSRKSNVKHLRDLWEARMNTSVCPSESSFLLIRQKKPNKCLDYCFPKEENHQKTTPHISCEEANMLPLKFKVHADETNDSRIPKLKSNLRSTANTKNSINNNDMNSKKIITADPNSSAEYPELQSSEDSYYTNSEESLMEIIKRNKKICHCLNGKQDDEYVEVKLNWTSDSDSEPKIFQTVTHTSELNCSNQSNMRTNKKQYESIPISIRRRCHELSSCFPESDKSFKFDLHSPKKVISVYTLTAMSTPTSSQSNMDTDHDECSKATEKQNASQCAPVIASKRTSTLEGDTYIDQGFETGSNDTQSPTRFRKSDCSMEEHFEHFAICSTPNRLNNKKLQHNMPNSVSPIKVTRKNIEKDTTPESPLAMNASEFWITFGNYTVSLKIHHCPWERLLLLRKAFVQEQITENLDINFGIDKQIFPLHSKSLLLIKELIERLSKKDYASYSYYWFCKANVWLPFKGPVITTARIRRVFKCLQEFRHENGNEREGHDCLTFGIDNYVFFTSHMEHATNSFNLSD